ncbi:MAG: hypothetical protein GKS06_19575 [Acidobacteria bacterium]|nr:hypothetical protein [Acidobacteriota bacterium]
MSDLERLHDLLASDDPAGHRRAAQMAAHDPTLQAELDAHDRLLAIAESWRESTVAPQHLRARVLAGVEAPAATVLTGRFRNARRWVSGLAAAASIVLAIVFLQQIVPSPDVISVRGRLLINDALTEASEAEARHAAAIAKLERVAAPILQRATDPSTDAANAAILLAYRDRLAAIDTAIAEVRGYLEDNPGLASARTVLLAAYIDKTLVLEEVLGTDETSDLG